MSSLVAYRRRPAAELRWTGSRYRPLDVGLIGLVLLTTIIALLAPVIAPYNPVQPVGDLDLGPFSPHHLLGTDSIGRDLFSRAILGIRTSWLSALVAVVIGLVVGGTVDPGHPTPRHQCDGRLREPGTALRRPISSSPIPMSWSSRPVPSRMRESAAAFPPVTAGQHVARKELGASVVEALGIS